MVPEVSNVLQQLFFDPTYSKSRKPWRVFFDCLVQICSSVLAGCRARREHGGSELWFTHRSTNYSCLTKRRGTCVKCLSQPWFLFRLRLIIGDFHLLLHLPQTIGRICLGNNVVSMLDNRSRSKVSAHTYFEGCNDVLALAVCVTVSLQFFLSNTEAVFIMWVNTAILFTGVQS